MQPSLAIARLSDDELKRIYLEVQRRTLEPKFLHYFAEALLSAEKREDFMTLRPIAVLFVGKYGLGCYLCEEPPEMGMEKSA